MPPGMRGHAEEQLVEHAHDHLHVREQRVEVGACDVAEIFDQHRARPDAALQGPPALVGVAAPRASARRTAPRRHRPSPRSSWCAIRTSAGSRNSRGGGRGGRSARRGNPRAAPRSRPRTAASLAVRALDLLVRHLDEVGALEHGGEQLDQLRIGAVDRIGAEPRVRGQLRIEIVVGVPQLLEAVEIFVVIDRRQHLADLPELLALAVVRELAMLDQRVEDVGLADRDEVASLVGGRGRAAVRRCCIRARPRRTTGRRW